jgi:hypothetical protein
MKRTKNRPDVRLPPVRLFLEDLQYVAEKLPQDTKIEFTQGEFVYDSVYELGQN